MNPYVSTGVFKTRDIESIIKICLSKGIKKVELSSDVSCSVNLLESIFKAKDDIDFLIHNYFPPPKEPFVLNLASTDQKTLRRSRQHCKTAIDLCLELGSQFYSVHSGYALKIKPELLGNSKAQSRLSKDAVIPYKIAYDHFINSLIDINEYARSRNVSLLIENNVITPRHVVNELKNIFLMVSPAEIYNVMKDVNSNNLGLLVDVGHLNVSANALGFDRLDFTKSLKPYIRAFHLSENDGQTDQNLPVLEDSWFLQILNEFPETAIVIEVYRLNMEQVKEQINLVSRSMNRQDLTL